MFARLKRGGLVRLAVVLLAAVAAGCSFNFMDQVVTARPGFRIPGTSYLEPDGDRVTYDGMETREGEVMLIIRVRPADGSAPAAPWAGDDKKDRVPARSDP